MLITACGSSSTKTKPNTTPAALSALPLGDAVVKTEPARFTVNIDNPYWPMKPGTRWTYNETDGGAVRQVEVVVTDQTKVMPNGITARVVRDTVTEGGAIVEDTIDWYAQDDSGNVWYLGEDTAEFKDGKATTTKGSWQAGAKGALPGIIVPAKPTPGMRYRQEYFKGEAEDNGEVLSTTETVTVRTGTYRNVLMTKDTSTLEPGVEQHKSYALGVGPVRSVGVSGTKASEELVKIDTAPANASTGPLGKPNP
jgi:hypothetical protein